MIVITGGVLSIFTVTEFEPGVPAPFVALQVITVPAVSAVSVLSLHSALLDAIPEPGSFTVHFTVTSVGTPLFQPAALGGGVRVYVMLGGLKSRAAVGRG